MEGVPRKECPKLPAKKERLYLPHSRSKATPMF